MKSLKSLHHSFSLSLTALGLASLAACGGTDSNTEDASLGSAEAALTDGPSCDAGTLFNPELGTCAAVNEDAKAKARTAARSSGKAPPNLREKRLQHSHVKQQRSAQKGQSDLPIPGGLGVGVSYNNGQLVAHEEAILYTHMVVHPTGIGQLPDWLFTTSTNRTEKGVEVVGIYLSAGDGAIGVFDWSCSATDPCQGGVTEPSWIWTRSLQENLCYVDQVVDGAGVPQDSIYYANSTLLDSGVWTNRVTFWNHCTSEWDLVYSHAYQGTQLDCSLSGACGWWGPIVENFFPLEGTTPIPELGFFDTILVHDGAISWLPPSETGWTTPPSSWRECYRTPNTSWSATNQRCGGDGALTATLQLTDNWDTGYCAKVDVVNEGAEAVSTWTVALDTHESNLSNTWSANFAPAGGSLYTVTPLAWNATIAPDASVQFGFCATKTGSNFAPTVSVVP